MPSAFGSGISTMNLGYSEHCISLIMYDVEHLSICILDIWVLFGKLSVKVFGSLVSWVVGFIIFEFQVCFFNIFLHKKTHGPTEQNRDPNVYVVN
jgi:hypothetical protein